MPPTPRASAPRVPRGGPPTGGPGGPPPPPAKGGFAGLMKKKIGPIPVPIAIGLLAVAGFLVYRHYKANANTAATPAASAPATTDSGSDLGNIGATPSSSGTPDTGVGSGLSVGDLEQLLADLETFGAAGAASPAANLPTPNIPVATQSINTQGQIASPQEAQTGGSAGPAAVQDAEVAAPQIQVTSTEAYDPGVPVEQQSVSQAANNLAAQFANPVMVNLPTTQLAPPPTPKGSTSASSSEQAAIKKGSGAPASGSGSSVHALGGGL